MDTERKCKELGTVIVQLEARIAQLEARTAQLEKQEPEKQEPEKQEPEKQEHEKQEPEKQEHEKRINSSNNPIVIDDFEGTKPIHMLVLGGDKVGKQAMIDMATKQIPGAEAHKLALGYLRSGETAKGRLEEIATVLKTNGINYIIMVLPVSQEAPLLHDQILFSFMTDCGCFDTQKAKDHFFVVGSKNDRISRETEDIMKREQGWFRNNIVGRFQTHGGFDEMPKCTFVGNNAVTSFEGLLKPTEHTYDCKANISEIASKTLKAYYGDVDMSNMSTKRKRQ